MTWQKESPAKNRCDKIVIEWNEIDWNRYNRMDYMEL
jgi:hypothetical protein